MEENLLFQTNFEIPQWILNALGKNYNDTKVMVNFHLNGFVGSLDLKASEQ